MRIEGPAVMRVTRVGGELPMTWPALGVHEEDRFSGKCSQESLAANSFDGRTSLVSSKAAFRAASYSRAEIDQRTGA